MKKNEFCQGQSLWEIVVALAIISLMALGLVRLTTTSIKSSRFSQDQSLITALAQQKIATIIDYKNQLPNDFWGGGFYPSGFVRQEKTSDGYCLSTTVSDVSAQLPTGTPDYLNAKMFLINVKVYWDEKSGPGNQCNNQDFNHNLSFETYVTN